MKAGFVEEYTNKERFCNSWLLIPGSSLLPDGLLAAALVLLLLYALLGIAVGSDILMDAIAKITSKTEMLEVCDAEGKRMMIGIPVWNARMANVTLVALASAAPELFLCFFSTFADIESVPQDIGPMALVGSASFNLLVVTGVSILTISEVKRVFRLNLFVATAAFATFAYVWVFLVLVVFSPAYIEFWEALLTLLFYPVLLMLVWTAEQCAAGNACEAEELEKNRRLICRQSLQSLADINGKMFVIDAATGRSDSADPHEIDRVQGYYQICLGVDNLSNTGVDELLQVLQPESSVERLLYR